MNLALDFGNTTTRLYLFEGAKFISKKVFKKFNAKTLKTVLKKHEIDASIISSVADFDKKITNELRRHTHFINLTYKTPVPILNKYETPKTLGMDRLGNAVAASALHPHDHVLVIDAGTCRKNISEAASAPASVCGSGRCIIILNTFRCSSRSNSNMRLALTRLTPSCRASTTAFAMR
jgi:hypothetical protein